MCSLLTEQRRIVAYLDGLQAKVNAFPLAALGDDVREPRKGVILQVKGGAPKGCDKKLRRSRTLTLSPCGMASILDKAFKGEL